MRKAVCIIVVMGTAVPALAADNGVAFYTPSAGQIAAIETRITDLPSPIYNYARYYTGEAVSLKADGGRSVVQRRVRAEFIPAQAGETVGVHVIEGRLPPLKGEGCIANLPDPPTDDVFEIYARCNRPGGWTPTAEEIAELEARIALPRGAGVLGSYVRHYAGVTESGVRLIRGVFVGAVAELAPSAVVGSEIELPIIVEDGCGAIAVQYNVETKLGSAHYGTSN